MGGGLSAVIERRKKETELIIPRGEESERKGEKHWSPRIYLEIGEGKKRGKLS